MMSIELFPAIRQRHIEKKYQELRRLSKGGNLFGIPIDWENKAEAFVAAYYLGKLETTELQLQNFWENVK